MLLVSCGTDLKLHNSPTYDLVNIYRPADSTGQIRNVSWCKDGSWLALVPNRGNAEIIRTKEDVRLLQTILGVAQPTAAVFQRTTKRNVAMSTVSGSVLIYDIKAKSIKKRFVNSGSSVTMIDWSLKDTHLVTGSTDGKVTLYSNTTNQRTSVMTVPDSKSVSVVRFHSTQRHMLGTASDEGVVAVWDINNNREIMGLKSHKAPVTDLVFSAQNSKLMVSVGLDRTFICYDISGASIALPVMTDHPLSAIDMAPDGITIAVASSRGTIYIYDLRHHENPLKTIAAHSGEIKRILYQPFALDSTTDSLHIAEEKPVDSNLEPHSSNVSVDSFANMLGIVNEISSNNEELLQPDEAKSKSNSAAGDSFFNGIDNFEGKRTTGSFMEKKSELSNLGLSDSVKKWLDQKKHHLELQSSPRSSPSVESNGKISDVPNIKLSSSTPRQHSAAKLSFLKSEELGSSNISPIVMPTPAITTEELNKMINSIVKEVVNEQISDLTDALSRYFLNLQLCFSKQFVSQESNMERLFDYYYGSAPNSNLQQQNQQLQQENEFLRSKINELMRKNNS